MDSKTLDELDIQEALCILLEVQEVLYAKLKLPPLEENSGRLFKLSNIKT